MVTTKVQEAVAKAVAATAEPKICHPSVCVGGAHTSNCVCPATLAK